MRFRQIISYLGQALLVHITVADAALRPVAHFQTPENAASCYMTHGRLMVYNGGAPNFRLWKIGTNRLLGIFSDARDMHCTRWDSLCPHGGGTDEDENPILPQNLEKVFNSVSSAFDVTVYADFEVCPLERAKPGAMQAACIMAATHLFVQRFKQQ